MGNTGSTTTSFFLAFGGILWLFPFSALGRLGLELLLKGRLEGEGRPPTPTSQHTVRSGIYRLNDILHRKLRLVRCQPEQKENAIDAGARSVSVGYVARQQLSFGYTSFVEHGVERVFPGPLAPKASYLPLIYIDSALNQM